MDSGLRRNDVVGGEKRYCYFQIEAEMQESSFIQFEISACAGMTKVGGEKRYCYFQIESV